MPRAREPEGRARVASQEEVRAWLFAHTWTRFVSSAQHASKHAAAGGHPIASSLEPGEDWSWCCVEQVAFVV